MRNSDHLLTKKHRSIPEMHNVGVAFEALEDGKGAPHVDESGQVAKLSGT
jgi:hypothetical protein